MDVTITRSGAGDESDATAPPARRYAPGSAVGRFVLLSRLGSGGMGTVFSAFDPQLDRKVAIKLLHPGRWGTESLTEGQQRLLVEARAMARLDHPNVVTVFDAGTSEGRVYLAMEHVAGTTLRGWLSAAPRSWREIAEICHRNGTLVLADGAHVPGNIALDIESLGVDWYTGNLHKWAWTPRSSGILWAAPERRSDLHPAVISWGLDNGLTAEFDLLGTRDPTPHLVAPFAIELMHSYGEGAVMSYNHGLAWWAGQYLSDLWGTAFSTPEEMIGAMVAVRLPDRFGDTTDDAARLQSELEGRGVIVPVTANPYGLTLRVSAQAYCDRADIERLGEAVLALR